DRPHEVRMRQGGGIHHEGNAGETSERFAVSHDLLDDLFRAADEERAGRPELRTELRAADRPPAALLPHLADRAGIPWEQLVRGLLRRLRDVAEAVHADLQS